MVSEGRAAERRSADESIIVALGGNLAASATALRQTLEAALRALPDHGLRVVRRSRIWRSAAWPDPSQPAFLNAIALVETTLGPSEAMAALHRVEIVFRRERGSANSPRTLDLDLIAYRRRVCGGRLTLPHPRAAERLFVMGPLAELLPDWRHPISGQRAVDLAEGASVGCDAAPWTQGS